MNNMSLKLDGNLNTSVPKNCDFFKLILFCYAPRKIYLDRSSVANLSQYYHIIGLSRNSVCRNVGVAITHPALYVTMHGGLTLCRW